MRLLGGVICLALLVSPHSATPWPEPRNPAVVPLHPRFSWIDLARVALLDRLLRSVRNHVILLVGLEANRREVACPSLCQGIRFCVGGVAFPSEPAGQPTLTSGTLPIQTHCFGYGRDRCCCIAVQPKGAMAALGPTRQSLDVRYDGGS